MKTGLLAIGILTALAGSAAADKFLGWSKNGTYWGTDTMLCASGDESKVVWGLPKPESDVSGEACNNDKGAEADKARADLVLPPELKALPAGMKLKADKDTGPEDFAYFTLTAKGKKTSCSLFGLQGAKHAKGASFWFRADGNALAVLFDERDIMQCDISKLGLGAQGGGGAAAAPAGDRKAATALNAKGMKAYKAHQWLEAMQQFASALAADPSFVAAHYDLASVAAIVGDLPTVRGELAWMAKSSDKEAARLLNKAMMDPDLDAASTDPEVRKLINAPPWADNSLHDNLTERNGVWSAEGAECGAPAFSFKFADTGSFTGSAVVTCKGKKQSQTIKGTWDIDGEKVTLKAAKAKSGADLNGAALSAAKCKGSAVAGSCLSVAGADTLLHRGVPEVTSGFKY